MNAAMGLGMLCGIGFGLLVLWIVKRDRALKCKYDERQELVRGKGFKYGFYTMILYNFLYASSELIFEKSYMDGSVAGLISIFLGMAVSICYCIWKDSYISLNENPKQMMIVFAVLGIPNLIGGIRMFLSGEAVQNGKLTIHCINLLCALMCILFFITLFLKNVCSKREDGENA